MLWLMKVLPTSVCTTLNTPICLVFYLLAKEQREAVESNLSALRPDRPGRSFSDGFEVFRQFGLTYLDRLWHLHFKRNVEWDIVGMTEFDNLKATSGGALIFTIHSGNYDIGASLFAEKFGRAMHTVRVPEQSESLQELRAAELAAEERRNPNLHVHYNEDGKHLGLELSRVLADGEVVAIQGDRVMAGVSPVRIVDGEQEFEVPLGPMVLAEMTRVPCYPIFLTRLGVCRYRVVIGPPFVEGGVRMKAAEIGQRWTQVMAAHLRQHWDQWFVFEKLVRKIEPKAVG